MSDSHFDLGAMANQEMLAEGFHPDFSPAVVQQVKALQAQPAAANIAIGQVRDLRTLLTTAEPGKESAADRSTRETHAGGDQ